MGETLAHKAEGGKANSQELEQAATTVLAGLGNMMAASAVSITKSEETPTAATEGQSASTDEPAAKTAQNEASFWCCCRSAHNIVR